MCLFNLQPLWSVQAVLLQDSLVSLRNWPATELLGGGELAADPETPVPHMRAREPGNCFQGFQKKKKKGELWLF